MPSVFVLGPSLDNVYEPMPQITTPGVATPGKRQVTFTVPPTQPGGTVNLDFLPGQPGDAIPINVHVFFFQPVQGVPPMSQRTPDWFFKNADAHGLLLISFEPKPFFVIASGVRPSLQPHFVQVVLEFNS